MSVCLEGCTEEFAHRPTVHHFCALVSMSRLSEPIRIIYTMGHCPAGHDSNGLAGSMSSERKVVQFT